MANSKQVNFSIVEIIRNLISSIITIGKELTSSNVSIEDKKIEKQVEEIRNQETTGYINQLERQAASFESKSGNRKVKTLPKVNTIKTTNFHENINQMSKDDYEIDDK